MNLAPYNLWSGTDYTKDSTGFSKNAESSTEWSVNGSRSMKLTRSSDNYDDYTTEYFFNVPVGDYLITFKIYSPKAYGNFYVFCNEGNQNIGFAKTEDVQLIQLHLTNKTVAGVRFVIYESNQSIHVDDFQIIPQ